MNIKGQFSHKSITLLWEQPKPVDSNIRNLWKYFFVLLVSFQTRQWNRIPAVLHGSHNFSCPSRASHSLSSDGNWRRQWPTIAHISGGFLSILICSWGIVLGHFICLFVTMLLAWRAPTECLTGNKIRLWASLGEISFINCQNTRGSRKKQHLCNII